MYAVPVAGFRWLANEWNCDQPEEVNPHWLNVLLRGALCTDSCSIEHAWGVTFCQLTCSIGLRRWKFRDGRTKAIPKDQWETSNDRMKINNIKWNIFWSLQHFSSFSFIPLKKKKGIRCEKGHAKSSTIWGGMKEYHQFHSHWVYWRK